VDEPIPFGTPLHSVAELARRAKKAGHLRPGFVLDDLILILMANDRHPCHLTGRPGLGRQRFLTR
jgi:hypothetical protein